MKVCHKIGEPYEVVVWSTCLKCNLNACVIQRLVRPMKIKTPSIITSEKRTKDNE